MAVFFFFDKEKEDGLRGEAKRQEGPKLAEEHENNPASFLFTLFASPPPFLVIWLLPRFKFLERWSSAEKTNV